MKDEDAGADFNAAKMVLSPMVGVFYASPSPSDPPFVTVGSKVEKGDVLCIIEAMKLMDDITAEEDGMTARSSISAPPTAASSNTARSSLSSCDFARRSALTSR